ncbi:fibronectin type III domain-containing protein [Nocardioides aurantiacus]|uniref:Pre-peptidase n=1 Tax=Nocardioides aurantiacus TaxID=86796 RepID=A0A3N2CRH5_9ACTN|nr:fibronectin type III domain-containing protein [Nocardioides aurantiacus]ROR90120.1 pre-peptidase [Nocardioides aurantiacus]
MPPHARRLVALGATAAIAAAVAVGSPGALPPGPGDAEATSDVAAAAPRREVSTRPATASTPPARPATPADDPSATGTVSPLQNDADAGRASGQVAAPDAQVAPVIDRERRGRDALRALGDQVGEAASRSGVSPQALATVLRDDDTAWVSREGQLYFQEPMATVAEGPVAGAVTTTSVDTAKTFTLHSRPGAKRSIVIDMDGADVRGSAWGKLIKTPLRDGTWAGWNSEGTASTYSLSEHAWIQEVWRQVSEYYAAFDVDVTTDSRDDGVWRRDTTADETYGARVVVTTSTEPPAQICASACIGQAWSGVFDRVDPSASYQPAWVFATPMGGKPMSPIVAAQSVAHEAGHTFGLVHDGITTNGVRSDYYKGTTLWGPLMGSSMTRGISQWSKGEYAGATSTQDDLAVIGSKLTRVPDEDGGTTASATDLPTSPSYDVAGVVSDRSDRDLYRLTLPCATTLTATATGTGPQASLDLQLALLAADGSTQLTSDQPTATLVTWPSTVTGMDASISRALPAGTYYLRVDGVGNGSASQAGVGWSDYGSLGRYRLRASGCAGTTPPSPTAGPTPTPSTAPSTTPAPVTTSPTPTTSPAPVVMTRPGAPTIGYASSGASGGTVSATARWSAPKVTGGQAVRGYKVRAYKLDSRNRVVRTYTTARTAANVRTLVYRLPRGRYTFVVTAENGLGASPWSSRSRIVTAR